MQIIISYVSLLFFLCWSTGQCDDNQCEKVNSNPCKCTRASDGASIDLNLIKSPLNFKGGDSYDWQYSPCQPIDCGQFPLRVALCKTGSDQSNYDMGDISTATFLTDGSNTAIKYTAIRDFQVSTTVKLECNSGTNGEMIYVKEDPQYTIYLTLKTKYACLPSPPTPTPTPSSGGLSVGDALLIIFFVGLFLYFVIGVLFLKFYRHVENGVDLIPNREFWVVLPFLFADGVKFVMYKSVWRNKAQEPYAQI